MSIEERRTALVAAIENTYGGQEVLRLADDYALEVWNEAHRAAMMGVQTSGGSRCWNNGALLDLKNRIAALGAPQP